MPVLLNELRGGLWTLRAAFCVAVPALIGWAAGDITAGLMATIGAFTSLYGSGRPYVNRGVHLGVIAMCFSLAVALGNWAAEVPWVGVLTVSLIAMVAVLVLASGCTMLSVDKRSFYQYDNPTAVEDGSFRRSLDAFGNAMVGGNSVEILNNGDAIFPAMAGAIRDAKATVDLESYIFKDDKAWQLDQAKVSEGRKLYRQHCFECHRGPVRDPAFDQEWPEYSFWRESNPDRSEKNWVTIKDHRYFNVVQKPVADIGTDRAVCIDSRSAARSTSTSAAGRASVIG